MTRTMNEAGKRAAGKTDKGRVGGVGKIAYWLLLALGLLFAVEPQTVFQVGTIMQFSVLELLLFALLGTWGLTRLLQGKFPRYPAQIVLPLALFWGSQVLATIFASAELLHAIKFCYRLTLGMVVGWCAYDLLDRPERWNTMLKALALGGALVGIVGFFEGTTASGDAVAALFRRGAATVGDLERVSSTLVYPTVTALVLELTLPLLFLWMVESRHRWQKVVLVTGLLFSMAALVLTLSRAGIGLLGFIFSAMAVGVWWRERRNVIGGTSGTLRRVESFLKHHPLSAAALGAAGSLGLLTVILLYFNPTARLRLVSETEETWYRAMYQSEPLPTLSPGARVEVPITITNSSPRAWDPSSDQPFLISYHLYKSDMTLVTYDGARTYVTRAIAPGASVVVNAVIHAPPETGDYLVAWDMLQEGVLWFSWKGNEPHTVSLTVAGTPLADEPLTVTKPPAGMYRIPTPTRFDLWRIAFDMLRANPLLGIGPDTFRLRYGYAIGMDTFDPHIHTNNQYIEFLVGSGVVGLAGFMAFTVALALNVWRSLRTSTGWDWRWRFTLALLLATWYVHGLVDSFWEFTPTFVLFWLLTALSLAPVKALSQD